LDETHCVLIIATMDTKAKETMFLKACLETEGLAVFIMDAGIRGQSPLPVDISRDQVAEAGGTSLGQVQNIGHEGKALDVMITGAIQCAGALYEKGEIEGVIEIGGSMGTTLGTGVMRTFPIGFPKVMISTMASRNTRPFVGTKDILMLHSVCDLSGLNRITRRVIREGGLALAGMVKGRVTEPSETRPLVVLSTLGTTEACAVRVREAIEKTGKEVVTFHTVGSGGEAMDELIRDEEVAAVVDLSLHELGDHLFGGDYDAGPNRGLAALEKGIPTVLVPGNTDFLVAGPLAVTKERFPGRRYHVHNAAISTVATDPEEMKSIAGRIAELCKRARGPASVLIPMGGFSAFDSPGGPLESPEIREVFSQTLQADLPAGIRCLESQHHINDPEFAASILEAVDEF
jgi:uncharacterized protein (UPF0261 family)